MPKRSNDFQKIILYLQSLSSPTFEVKESHFLKDSITGQMREVDIIIESNTAGYESIVSIEVIGWKTKKGDIEWVERMACKHATLPTTKLVLVSKSGFTKNALIKANFLNIVALTIEEALTADWDNFVKSLGRFEEIQVHCQCRIDTIKYITDKGPPEIKDTTIYTEKDINKGLALQTILDSILQSENLKDKIFQTMERNSSKIFHFPVHPTPPLYVLELNNKFREVACFHLEIEAKQKTYDFKMSSGSFKENDVAFGKHTKNSESATIVLIKNNTITNKISGIIEDKDGIRSISGQYYSLNSDNYKK